ncbi:iron ABC transporter permease [Paenibacillus sp. HN-1]|uniref:FecCD family ABC transporter permease n=1 Tax=Paenibacillus TaxID=44249 RepID=UPI001CA7BB1B|nr:MULTISPECIES: iron ABC transporter permease [Paenibacillus]MBY9077338.1 iron ABC transporter permease [Paenibacillus sp. CGMCC 1.18879]MBY9085658.1 iron ABC transporter permease [Paenibacillus sinensis]
MQHHSIGHGSAEGGGIGGKTVIRGRTVAVVLILCACVVFLGSFTWGRYGISLEQMAEILAGRLRGQAADWSNPVETVLLKVRVPRIFAAMLIGSALAVSGVAYQGLFRNPMVSSDILGASAGSGFGAAVGILMSAGTFGVQALAFVFGLAAVLITYVIGASIGRRGGMVTVLGLLLTGMVVSALFGSLTSLIKYAADPYSKLPAITFWMMGGLSAVTGRDLLILLIPGLLGSVPLLCIRWQMNVMCFGEEEAEALGVNVRRIRMVVILCSTLLTASAVAVGGMIGWVGLVVPHMARLLVGPDHKTLLPVSMGLGAIYLLAVDDLARSMFAQEIPLGILTAVIGAPFFLYLLVKGRG